MARRKKGQLESVGKLLKAVYPAPDQLEAAKVFAWWSRSVPPRILEHARPVTPASRTCSTRSWRC